MTSAHPRSGAGQRTARAPAGQAAYPPPGGQPRRAPPAWQALAQHASELRAVTLGELFDRDPDRGRDLTVETCGLYADFAKHHLTRDTVRLLAELACECGLAEATAAMFAGEPINTSERRPALHVALRAPRGATILLDGHTVVPDVHSMLDRMAGFANRVRDGRWTGHTGKPIRTVVNIGIGGSDLGPRMAYHALRRYADPRLQARLLSNVDGAAFVDATRDLDPAETLFVVVSKSWHTSETLANATTARAWVLDAFAGDTAAVARHFAAVSANADGVAGFGIDPANMFGFWDWVGGRYSLDSAVGLSLMIMIGAEHFTGMLGGFRAMDEHFLTAPPGRNLPALMGLISVWYNNFLGAQTEAVMPYSHALAHLPGYLQQLEMESNGKRVTLTGRRVDHQTGQIIWGQPGTNGQHAFYQLLHQGTKLVPADLIGVTAPLSDLPGHHDLLVANLFAQAEALAFGRTAEQLRAAGVPDWQVPYRICPGNQPTTMLLLDTLSPRSLGSLLAAYEHKVFTEGVIWGIDSFDQWGVELGKILAGAILDDLTADQPPAGRHDSSTSSLIRRYRRLRHRRP